ncbi:MAG: c-type cytochrome [Pseudomonadales bacterium]
MTRRNLFVFSLSAMLLAACTSRCSPVSEAPTWEQRYQSMDIPDATPLNADQALNAFRTAPGVKVELIASEPLIGDPVAMEWDEYGRLYVVEMRGFMRDSYGKDETGPHGRVVRLSDTNQDGKMDRSELFLDGLVNPRAVAVVNEGVLIGEPPNLWLCEMPDSENLCDTKRRLGDYGNGDPDDVEHDENRLLRAANGWLYSAKSELKRRVINGELETEATAFRGQWGLSADEFGRLLYNTNSTLLLGDFFPAHYLMRSPYQGLGPDAGVGLGELLTSDQQVHSIRINPGVNRAYTEGVLRDDNRLNMATAASGLQFYSGSQFPESMQGNVFVPEPAGNLVVQLALKSNGVGVSAQSVNYADEQWGERAFLASTDERFRPVDMRVGPDGALYLIDMYRGVIQHRQFISDELRAQSEQRDLVEPIGMGRIYRLSSETASAAPSYALDSSAALIKALQHVDLWPRQTAARLLGKEEYRPVVAVLSIDQMATHAKKDGLWLKYSTDTLSEEDVLAGLASPGASRIAALQMAKSKLSSERLLGWAAANADSLSELEALHLLAGLGSDQESRAFARQLLAKHVEDTHFRRVYVAGLNQTASSELQAWLSGLGSNDSDGHKRLLTTLSMMAYLDARENISIDTLNDDVSEYFAWMARSISAIPSWQAVAWLDGMREAAKAENFVAVEFQEAPAIMSVQTSTDKELSDALYEARVAFTWPGDDFVAGLQPLSESQQQLVEKGKVLYASCAACHGNTGQGLAGLAPPLGESDWVNGPPEWLARIVLHGVSGPMIVRGEEWNMTMPGHGHIPSFDDQSMAGLLTYIRRQWGNAADAVSVEQIASIRAATADRARPWTAVELEKVKVQSPFSKYEGTYKIPFMPISFDVIAGPDHIVLEAPQGSTKIKPDANGVYSVPDMKFSFVFEERSPDEMVILLTRGKDEIELKRK